MVEEVRVTSWAHLDEQLYAESWFQPHGRFRSPYVFRGVAAAGSDLKTCLMRLGGHYGELEDDLLRNFRKYAHREAAPGGSWWNWLAVAQHHGLPTRLLDWTFSPFVALHFATADFSLFAADAVVWAVDCIAVQEFLPEKLREILKQEGATVFSAEMLDRYAGNLADFDRRVREEQGECVVFFEPPSLDERIVNQMALFSMMSSAEADLWTWLARREQKSKRKLYRKIVIPAPLKWEIRDKLDMANVNERVMFPGLDGLSAWLKRYYSPNNIIEITYFESDGQPHTYPAVITGISNAMMEVAYHCEREGRRTARLFTREGSIWWDECRDSAVAVNPEPAAEKTFPANLPGAHQAGPAQV
ncbi:MAG: FRG domain-containing protein [Bryobacteraceae bacterium]|nr:FRG domain-containing protein [Bryobacteraceae bacterium]